MHKTTISDDEYRRNIVDLILADCAGSASDKFVSQNGFAAWTRKHKRILVQLFSGQGIQRLAQIVAWIRRESTGRRDPPENLCYLADLFATGAFDSEEPILADRWKCLNDVIRDAMLDPLVAEVVMRQTADGLSSVARTALMVLICQG